ncbi:Protein CBG05669 [Caenorhabditis briggsae]|uniref:Protein CBG05669 n=1 Tax=Caenorhabditis briggsae TaxID=6238 RepID=A8X0E4_CAEBR|nr:Protein CBG05669 [Caenorhabditis briggsae]CAP26104.1 Protein CBG05669 [Caenorhabditis briggsae]
MISSFLSLRTSKTFWTNWYTNNYVCYQLIEEHVEDDKQDMPITDKLFEFFIQNAIFFQNQCVPFEYTGCGGNLNNFVSMADCMSTCGNVGFR